MEKQLTPEMPGPIYDVRCPKCHGRAVGQTYAEESHGRFGDSTATYGVKRVVCGQCGFMKTQQNGTSLACQFWFRISVAGRILWAKNESHLRYLRALLSRETISPSTSRTMPEWLLNAGTRQQAVLKIDRWLENPLQSPD